MITNTHPRSLEYTSDCYEMPSSGLHKSVDYAKAVSIINQLQNSGRRIRAAYLGLDGDWNENNELIFDGDTIFSYEGCDSSRWATPVLYIEFDNGTTETYACWTPSYS